MLKKLSLFVATSVAMVGMAFAQPKTYTLDDINIRDP